MELIGGLIIAALIIAAAVILGAIAKANPSNLSGEDADIEEEWSRAIK